MIALHLPAARRQSPRPACLLASLTLALILALHSASVSAQSLMVGTDGAVHLDELSETTVADPVIIDQQPELVGPSVPTGMPGGAFYPPGAYAGGMVPYGAVCPTPMAACLQPMNIVSPRPIRHAIFGEFLFLHPTGADVAHAVQQDGTGGAGTVPFGRVGVTDLHYEPGVRIGGDLAVSQCTSIAATYTYFESNASQRLDVPAGAMTVPSTLPLNLSTIDDVGGPLPFPGNFPVLLDVNAIGSLVHHPGAAITASAGPVDARTVVNFQIADADYRALLLNDKCYWLNGSLGLRWGHLEQEFGQSGLFSGSSGGLIVTQTDVDFDGGGVKFGVDGGRTLGKRGFSIYGRAGVSPLVGQFKSSYVIDNQTTGTRLAQALWDDDRFVTLLDYEVGFAWTGPQRKWRFATGYTASFWYNVVTQAEFIGAVQQGDYTDVSDTITFDGLTARIERMW